jgi:hypothetical protein
MTQNNRKESLRARGLLTLMCVAAVPAVLASAPVLSAADAGATTDAAPAFEQPAAGTPDFTGKWANTKPGGHLLTATGGEPPLNAAAKTEYAKRQAALKSGDHTIDPVSSCLMHGIPRLMLAPYPFLILQTTRNLNFVHEANHTFRNIYWVKAPAPEDADPTYLGNSGAHFEGKTLVIDSVGFNDQTWLDYTGLPHGEKMTVQERYVMSDPSTINASVTITDPEFYTAPWTTKFTLNRQPGMTLRENVCLDTHKM